MKIGLFVKKTQFFLTLIHSRHFCYCLETLLVVLAEKDKNQPKSPKRFFELKCVLFMAERLHEFISLRESCWLVI